MWGHLRRLGQGGCLKFIPVDSGGGNKAEEFVEPNSLLAFPLQLPSLVAAAFVVFQA